jgi:hypothetical protein
MHKVTIDGTWFNDRYRGEDRDDGCANELSLYHDPTADQLDILLTNVDFNQVSHDNTFALNREDAQRLRDYLQDWLDKQK